MAGRAAGAERRPSRHGVCRCGCGRYIVYNLATGLLGETMPGYSNAGQAHALTQRSLGPPPRALQWSACMLDELVPFGDDIQEHESPPSGGTPWKVLVVDDDDEVHDVTRLVLHDLRIFGRPLNLLYAHSARQARAVLRQHPDTAVALLDVVM